jgi:ABC-type uncharacterized transport system substrate-binding protein
MRNVARSTAALGARATSTASLAIALAVAFSLLVPTPASAHPHVWVTMRSALIYRADGAVTGIRHDWTFDDMFSAFAVQGLPHKDKDKYTREELASLAEVNVTSLKEYGYFTRARADDRKLVITDPVDYWLEYVNGALTLHFTLPLQKPVAIKDLMFEIYDPTWFVDFTYVEKDPVALIGAPADCHSEVMRPSGFKIAQGQQLGEAYFNSLGAGSNFGAQFANKVFVRCPSGSKPRMVDP